MIDRDGTHIGLGDMVQLWSGKIGRVVCAFDDGQNDPDYVHEWAHKGILIRIDDGELFYYPDADEDICKI